MRGKLYWTPSVCSKIGCQFLSLTFTLTLSSLPSLSLSVSHFLLLCVKQLTYTCKDACEQRTGVSKEREREKEEGMRMEKGQRDTERDTYRCARKFQSRTGESM